jgi:hypothetical protein
MRGGVEAVEEEEEEEEHASNAAAAKASSEKEDRRRRKKSREELGGGGEEGRRVEQSDDKGFSRSGSTHVALLLLLLSSQHAVAHATIAPTAAATSARARVGNERPAMLWFMPWPCTQPEKCKNPIKMVSIRAHLRANKMRGEVNQGRSAGK